MSDESDAPGPDDPTNPRLTVVCSDGARVGCTNSEAIDSGVLLFEDRERNRAFGFVPHDEVRFAVRPGRRPRSSGRR